MFLLNQVKLLTRLLSQACAKVSLTLKENSKELPC